MSRFAVVPIAWLGFAAISAQSADLPSVALEDDLVVGLGGADVAFGRIVDVAVDSDDRMYVLDASARTIHKLAPDGRHLATIGRAGEGPGEFYAPRDLAIGSDDRLYVAGGDFYIEVFAADGTPEARIPRVHPSAAQSIAVDDDGDVYVVAFDILEQTMVHKYDGASGQPVRSFCDSYAVGHDIDTREETVYAKGSIAIQGDRIYYVQSYPHELRVFDLDGELVEAFDGRRVESEPPRVDFGTEGDQLHVPHSLSRTVVPLGDDRLLTILARPFGAPGSSGHLDVYRTGDGARVASLLDPPTAVISCRDDAGRLYSAEVRDDTPVIVRYRLRGEPGLDG